MSDGRICRLCLWRAYERGSDATHLVDLIADGNDLLKKISACLPLKVSKEDKLPKYVCNMCSRKIEDFYQFRNRALDSESRLLNGFKFDEDLGDDDDPFRSSEYKWSTTEAFKDEAEDESAKSRIASIVSGVEVEFEEFKFPDIKRESDDNVLNTIKSERSECSPLRKRSQLVNSKNRKATEGTKKYEFVNVEPSRPGSGSNMNSIWSCCICFLNFTKRIDILKHYRSHCITVKMENVPIAEDHKWERFYRCSLCEKMFKSPESILKHGKVTHSFSSNEQNKDEKTVLSEPTSKRYTCDICNEKFVYMKYLLLHRNAEHPETRNQRYINKCDFCHQEFTHINSLRRHLKSSHSDQKDYLCNTCGKALSSKEHLKFHMRIHTGYKPNVCRECGKGFVKKCNLILHERVHSGERPHVCSFCGKAFSQKSTLVIHERYHSGSRPYVCKLCNKGFVAQGLLSVHLKTVCNKKNKVKMRCD